MDRRFPVLPKHSNSMKSLLELSNLQDKRVLVRVDWNVPIVDGRIVDDFRIKKSLPTINFLQKAGAKVIIVTHLEPEDSSVDILKPYVPNGAELLPNLRNNAGEKANSIEFAETLAKQADIFVNEAFSASHREHASVVGVPKLLPSYAGLEFEEEVKALSKAFNPPHPFLIILGGAKFETKLPLVNKFVNIADNIHIAGAMGVKVPPNLRENPKISLPLGDIAALDADKQNLALLQDKINQARFIVWNGPLGKYEAGYKEGTERLARMIIESGREAIVGGADTLAVIKDLNLYNQFAFVSTGGGAMLDFLATGTLPGIEALK